MGRREKRRRCLVVEEESRILRMLRDPRYLPPTSMIGDSKLIQSATGDEQLNSRSLTP